MHRPPSEIPGGRASWRVEPTPARPESRFPRGQYNSLTEWPSEACGFFRSGSNGSIARAGVDPHGCDAVSSGNLVNPDLADPGHERREGDVAMFTGKAEHADPAKKLALSRHPMRPLAYGILFTQRLLPSVLVPLLLGGSVNAQPDAAAIAKLAASSDSLARVTKEQWRADLRFLRARTACAARQRLSSHITRPLRCRGGRA